MRTDYIQIRHHDEIKCVIQILKIYQPKTRQGREQTAHKKGPLPIATTYALHKTRNGRMQIQVANSNIHKILIFQAQTYTQKRPWI